MKPKPSKIVNWVREIFIAEGKMKSYKPHIPTHGTCCTCHYSNESDDCPCESNDLNKLFDLIAKEADEHFT